MTHASHPQAAYACTSHPQAFFACMQISIPSHTAAEHYVLFCVRCTEVLLNFLLI